MARRFRVSLGMVKKLLQQRRHTGSIAARHHLAGRKPRIVQGHQREMRVLLGEKPDLTLKELRGGLRLECSLQAIHVVLRKMGLTYKKRVFGRPNTTVPTSARRGGAGGVGKADSTRRGSSSSTNRAPAPTRCPRGARPRRLCQVRLRARWCGN